MSNVADAGVVEMVEGHDGCYFLDGMTREELKARMAQARADQDEALAVIAGCGARLAAMETAN